MIWPNKNSYKWGIKMYIFLNLIWQMKWRIMGFLIFSLISFPFTPTSSFIIYFTAVTLGSLSWMCCYNLPFTCLLPASPGNYPIGRIPWPLWVWPGSAEQHQALLSAGLLLPGASWQQRELSPLAFALRNGTTGLVHLHSR